VNRRGRRFERKESFSVFAQKDVKEYPGVRGGGGGGGGEGGGGREGGESGCKGTA